MKSGSGDKNNLFIAKKASLLSINKIKRLLTVQGVIRHFLKIAIDITQSDSGSFVLFNPNTGFLDIEASFGLKRRAKKTKLRVGEGITGWVATSGKPLRIDDVSKDWRYVSIDPRIRSELAVPIEWQSTIVGVLNVDSHEKSHYKPQHEKQLETIASEAAQWLSYAWEIEKLRQQAKQLSTLIEIGRTIVSQEDLEKTLEGVVRNAVFFMNANKGKLFLLNREKSELLLIASYDSNKEDIKKEKMIISLSESIFGVVVKKCKPLAIQDIHEESLMHCPEFALENEMVSFLAVPLVFGKECQGLLAIFTATPHRFSNSQIQLLQTLADLSAVALAKARLLERIVQTEENLREGERLLSLGLLAAEIAHEIRNPLTVIHMLLHSLKMRIKEDPVSQRDLEILEKKMSQLNRIVDQVLVIGRSTEPALEAMKVEDIIDDVLLLSRHKLAGQRIEVQTKISPLLPNLKADRAQVEQAVLNLILNAIQAMEEGGMLEIIAELQHNDAEPYLAIRVKDTGSGMTQAEIEDIFVPFLTRKKEGTGLGLAIVQKIMENHRGKVEVHSTLGQGSTFSLLFPLLD
ncbi:histidine kinase [Methylacidiphilum sp. Yel]|jgi:signal transduction histidine kinase|uniref:GAF domain-containing protein n=1 Tax=Methylacidiphilum sp. Yel TaxID=1847730 RepID=UPI00106A7019|nr:GAF domain-containing protein [Methylacidiphilum sp. Yel]TFE70420.1 histidine kinase [Methylacidiphilum sp. Yel]